MTELSERVARAVEVARGRLSDAPVDVLMVLGSGLGDVAAGVADAAEIPMADLPGTATSTVPGHRGVLRHGRLEGVGVLVQQGRLHLYEGHDAAAVTRPVSIAAALGADTMIVTNAAGGLDPEFAPGDLMLIEDHLNLTGTSPLTGVTHGGEPPFVDMADAYDPALRREALAAAEDLGVALRRGVYAGLTGPSYETPAEVEMLRRLGAHAVGMSTVLEVIMARAHGLRVLGVSSITNVHGPGVATSHEEVLEVGARAAEDLARLLPGVLRQR